MAKFVYLYTGGQRPETPDEQQQVMQQWGTWLESLGSAVVDGGSPFAASATVSSGGSSAGGGSAIGGYSIVEADSLDDASGKAAGCPVISTGGAVEVYEAVAM